MRVGILRSLARPSRVPLVSGGFSPQDEDLYVEDSVLSKLSRYETAIERTLYRALHELDRRQAARLGAAVTPPQVLDIEVSGMSDETGH